MEETSKLSRIQLAQTKQDKNKTASTEEVSKLGWMINADIHDIEHPLIKLMLTFI